MISSDDSLKLQELESRIFDSLAGELRQGLLDHGPIVTAWAIEQHLLPTAMLCRYNESISDLIEAVLDGLEALPKSTKIKEDERRRLRHVCEAILLLSGIRTELE